MATHIPTPRSRSNAAQAARGDIEAICRSAEDLLHRLDQADLSMAAIHVQSALEVLRRIETLEQQG